LYRSLLGGIIPQGYADLYPAAGQQHPLSCGNIPVTEAGSKTGVTSVYDYVFDAASRSWQLWSIPAGGLVIPEGASFSDIIVPTKDSARWVLQAAEVA
jgi:dynein heavy chain